MGKIIFAGLYNEENFGDPIIAKCTEAIYRKTHYDKFEAFHLDISCVEHAYFASKTFRLQRKLKHLLGSEIKQTQYKEKVLKLSYHYFDKICKDATSVIFVGGGLIKFMQQWVGIEMATLIQAANKHTIPVYLCSVGTEGYDETNKDCQYIKQSLSLPCVKYISTRDDFYTLKELYFKGKPLIPCEKVADPAVWASEVYEINKNPDSEFIGVGVARRGIFREYGKDIDDESIINLYKDIIRKLIALGKKVKVFTNGLPGDNLVAQELYNNKWGGHIELAIPKTPKELINIISNLKAVIATRLHACIISYSLNIPVVGLVWNDKLKFFGENIGRPDNFITINNLSSEYIINQLQKATSEGYDKERRDKFRATIVNSIASFDKHS